MASAGCPRAFGSDPPTWTGRARGGRYNDPQIFVWITPRNSVHLSALAFLILVVTLPLMQSTQVSKSEKSRSGRI